MCDVYIILINKEKTMSNTQHFLKNRNNWFVGIICLIPISELGRLQRWDQTAGRQERGESRNPSAGNH